MKIRGVLAGLVTLLMVLTAFAMLPTVPAKAQTEGGNTLFIAMQQDMPDLNTWNLASNSVWKANVLGFGFEALVGLDYDLKPYPLLAENYTFDEPTLTYTFHLRHGVQFNDGVSGEMKADDVVFMYKAAREQTTLSANIINAFDANGDGAASAAEMDAGVVKVDDFTVKMIMPKPFGQFLTQTAGIYIQPKAIWQNHLTDTGILDVLWNSPQATVSTGPFHYAGGIASTYRVMDKFTGYWGKNFTTPLGYKTFPPNIDHLYYKIYASLDTAILALQAGAVDYIDWAVTAGRVPGLQSDPNIGLSFLPENGYYYLSFNEKYEPMNNLSFRQAVSHLINKDQIVNVYLGGYGTKGSACEPPFWGLGWHNNSVATYPFNTTAAVTLLNQAGYVDIDSDGLREMPNGLPMPTITILTPPADYDPVRIRAGEAIALNMRSVGIDATAKALDFDTLVAKLQSMDFQMLIIGWSLASEPVGNVFDILGPLASSNTFGFWSLANPNPFYSSLGGVVTRADATSQALADKVLELGNLARGSFSTNDQQKYTKWAEGLIADAVPVNVLYYRVNVEAYRNAWTGWIPYLGTLLQSGANIYCLSNLKLAGGGAAVGATAAVNAGLNLPGDVPVGEAVTGIAVAIDQTGAPVSGGTVTVSVEGKGAPATVQVQTGQSSGTTAADGTYSFNVTALTAGYSYVNVTITKSSVESKASAVIRGVTQYPKILALTATPDKLVLRPGESMALTVNVTNEVNAPVSGATVAVDPNLVGFGHMAANSVVTNEWGGAVMTYLAPTWTEFNISARNKHLTLTLSMNVSKAGYATTGAASVLPLIYNEAPSDWSMVEIVSATPAPALNSAANETIITVRAVDQSNTPLSGFKLNVSFSDDTNVVALTRAEREPITNGAGLSAISVRVKADAPSTAFKVVIRNVTVTNTVPAVLTVTYRNATPPAGLPVRFAGYVTWSLDGSGVAAFMPELGAINATMHIWNDTGVPTNKVGASIVISTTPSGDLASSDLTPISTNFEGWGMVIATKEDNGAYVTGGPYATKFNQTNFDYWASPDVGYIYAWAWGDVTAVNITNGLLEIPVVSQGVAPADYMSNVLVIPGGIGFFNGTSLSYEIDGATSLEADYVLQRGSHVTATSMSITNAAGDLTPAVRVPNIGVGTARVYGFATDENNEPVADAELGVFQAFLYYARATDFEVIPYLGNPSRPDSVMTNADGNNFETIVAQSYSTGLPGTTGTVPVTARCMKSGTVSQFAIERAAFVVQQGMLRLDPITEVSQIGDKIAVVAHVTNVNGNGIPGIQVIMTVSGGAVLDTPTLGTDQTGKAVFTIDTSQMGPVRAAYIGVSGSAAGPGFTIASSQLAIPVKNPGPTVSVGAPLGTKVDGANVSLEGSATSMLGFTSVKVKLDSEATVTLVSETASTTVSLSHAFGKLKSGSHTIVVNATDALGVSTEKTVTFTVKSAGVDILPWSIAAIGWILFVIVAVMMMMRGRKPKEETMTPGAGEAAPPPEQKM